MAKKILIVDDDRDLVMSLEQAIKMNNYEVAVAYSGTEGLKKILSEKPDLVILDVMMETDTAGFEAAYQIRSELPTSKYKDVKNVPIIILTAIAQTTNSRFSLNDQDNYLPKIDDFLTKPIKINDLLEKVKNII
jgi:DNA-binding response OmpR family regulator